MERKLLKTKQSLSERYKSGDRKFTLEESRQLRAIKKKQEQKNFREESLAKFRATSCTTPILKPRDKTAPSTGTKKYTRKELEVMGKIRYKEMLKWKEERNRQLEKEKNSRKPSFKSGVFTPDPPHYLATSKRENSDHETPSKFSQTLRAESSKATPSVSRGTLGTKKTLVFHTGVTPLPGISSLGISMPLRKRSQRTFRPPPELGVDPLLDTPGGRDTMTPLLRKVDSFAPLNFNFKAPNGLESYNLKQNSSILKSLSNLSSKVGGKKFSKQTKVKLESAYKELANMEKVEESKENDPSSLDTDNEKIHMKLQLEEEDDNVDQLEESLESSSVEEKIGEKDIFEDEDVRCKEQEDTFPNEEDNIPDTKKSLNKKILSEDEDFLQDTEDKNVEIEDDENCDQPEDSMSCEDDHNVTDIIDKELTDVILGRKSKADKSGVNISKEEIYSNTEENATKEMTSLEENEDDVACFNVGTDTAPVQKHVLPNTKDSDNEEDQLLEAPRNEENVFSDEGQNDSRILSVRKRARSPVCTPPLSKLRPRTPCSRSTRRSKLAHCNSHDHPQAKTPKSTQKRGRKSSVAFLMDTMKQTERDVFDQEDATTDDSIDKKPETKTPKFTNRRGRISMAPLMDMMEQTERNVLDQEDIETDLKVEVKTPKSTKKRVRKSSLALLLNTTEQTEREVVFDQDDTMTGDLLNKTESKTPKSTKRRGRKSSMALLLKTTEQTERENNFDQDDTMTGGSLDKTESKTPKSTKRRGRKSSMALLMDTTEQTESEDAHLGDNEDKSQAVGSLNVKTPLAVSLIVSDNSEELSAKRIRELEASPWITRSRGSSSSRSKKKRRSVFELIFDEQDSEDLPAGSQGASPSFKENQRKLLELLSQPQRVPESPESCVWGPDSPQASPMLAEESKLESIEVEESKPQLVPLTPALKTGKRGRQTSKSVSLLLPTDKELLTSTTKYPVTPIARRSSTNQRVSLLPGLSTHNEGTEMGYVPTLREGEDLITWDSLSTEHTQEVTKAKKRGRKSRQSLINERVSLLPGLDPYPEEGEEPGNTPPVDENTDLISWDSPSLSQAPGTDKRRKSRKSLSLNTPNRRSTRLSQI